MHCITLLSDFGLQDASIASAKGILMQHLPDTTIVDITHEVKPFHLQQAAYLLVSAYRNFAQGTCHIVLIDIFSEKNPKMLLCEKDGHYFIAPDNGLLSIAFGITANAWKYYELNITGSFKDWLHATGRLVKDLQHGNLGSLQLEHCDMKNAPKNARPITSENSLECHIIHIDRYENVVVNVTREQFEEVGKGRRFNIQFMRDEEITELSTHYHNVRVGDKLCRFNSSGYLEIAINRGNAASLFGLKLLSENNLIYNTIKIYFE